MKLFTEKKLIEFCEAEPNQIENGAYLLSAKLGDHSWIQDGLQRGFYKALVTKIDGVPRYLFVWHMSDQNYMVINAGALLGTAQSSRADNFAGLLPGLLDFARALPGCRGVDCVTMRPGLVKHLFAAGFKPVGVSLSLAL